MVDQRQSVVTLDLAPERCHTITGRALAGRVIRLGACFGVVASAVWSVAYAHKIDDGQFWGTFVTRFLLMIPVCAVSSGPIILAGLWQDLSLKRGQLEKYGLSALFGFDTSQSRIVSVALPLADFEGTIVQALRSAAGDVPIDRESDGSFRCHQPRNGMYLVPCDITVRILETSPERTVIAIASKARRMLTDGGRNIVNVEEFQLALKRLLEGVPGSEGGQRHGG